MERQDLLCNDCDEWHEKLEKIVIDSKLREEIATNAYNYCKVKCVTLYTGFKFANYIRSMYNPNVAFILPALNISGGIMVAFEH